MTQTPSFFSYHVHQKYFFIKKLEIVIDFPIKNAVKNGPNKRTSFLV